MLLIAALFVQKGGCYCGLPNIDPWDISRDACKYDGPLPVIAHPPCQRWGSLTYVNYARYGGEHNRPGNDGGCFASAMASVRKWGGVLEHPAFTHAWPTYGLTRPYGIGWHQSLDGGWVCEMWQSAYGHRAQKRTWLYYCGKSAPAELRWERTPGTHQVGCACAGGNNKPTLSKKEANATPIEFRDALISMVTP
jgi:hypothetical protein